MRTLILLGLIMFSPLSFADLVNPEMVGEDETVIDPSYTENIAWEEPAFGSLKKERDIASWGSEDDERSSEDFQMEGQLTVLKEIPYTYPQSLRYLQKRTLAELEAERNKKKNSQ